METKFNLDIHKKGEYATDILNMISNHNGGKARIDIDVICGFLMAKKAMYPHEKLFIKTEGENGQTVHISDDGGETFYLTITEQEKNDYPVTEATCEIVINSSSKTESNV